MEAWAWLLAYLVGFALLQLYLYRYFMKSTTTAPEPTPVAEGGTRAVDVPENVPTEALVSCPECGAYNENHPMFTFCRECGDRLK